jgi:hypothetical protein
MPRGLRILRDKIELLAKEKGSVACSLRTHCSRLRLAFAKIQLTPPRDN